MVQELNNSSTIIGQPKSLKVKLFKHQLAMLYRCLNIEKENYSFGVMCDIAGTGKTAVIISLILSDLALNKKSRNLVIVPQNLCIQWVEEVQKFSDLKVKLFTEYHDISELMFAKKPQEIIDSYHVLVTSSAFYEVVTNIFKQVSIKINRMIFDEIDSIDSLLQFSSFKESQGFYYVEDPDDTEEDLEKMKKIKNHAICDMTWFVSASFYNVIDPKKGYVYGDKVIPLSVLDKIICKCDADFIANSGIRLEEPYVKKYNCKGLVDIYQNCLSPKQLDYINSLSYQEIRHSGKTAETEKECLDIIVKNIYEKIMSGLESLKSLETSKKKSDVIRNSIEEITKQINFNEKLLDFFHSTIHSESTCIGSENKLQCILDYNEKYSKQNPESKTKLYFLQKIIDSIDITKDKYIIFTDFVSSFKILSILLDKKNIKYQNLQGGNIQDIDSIIKNYKNGDTCILLIDSSSPVCVGLNLENTTDILMIHHTNETMYNQIVGRAQRGKRNTRLNVHILLNENESI
ncbi:MAG TPA: SNF2-related protein [Allocoleopsis sp.]